MDDYLALIGAAPSSKDQLSAIAAELRRRRMYGDIASITGDKVLAPFGENLRSQADAYAKQLQDIRQKDIDNAQTKAYQDAQLKHMAAVLAETRRGNNLDYAAQMAAIAQRRDDSLLDFAGAGAKGRNLTDSTRNKMLAQADTIQNTGALKDSFDDKYTQIYGAGPQSRLPNALASVGLGGKDAKDAAQWWSEWKKFYTLGTRNQLFGATLTPNEQKAWAEVDINPSMSAKQIRERMTKLHDEVVRAAKRRASEMTVEGFDPEVITQMYQDAIPDLDVSQYASPVRGPLSRTRRQRSSSSTPEYTREEIVSRIRELEEKARQE